MYLTVLPGAASVCVCLFLSGMFSGSLIHEGIIVKTSDIVTSTIAALLISFVFVAFSSVYTLEPIILLGGAFYFIASGTTLFSLLTSRPARRLGNVSYGIYLLQGLSFATVFMFAPAKDAAVSSPFGHWLIVLLCAILLVAAATISHVLIERPGIVLGKRVADAFGLVPRMRRPRGNLVSDSLVSDPNEPEIHSKKVVV